MAVFAGVKQIDDLVVRPEIDHQIMCTGFGGDVFANPFKRREVALFAVDYEAIELFVSDKSIAYHRPAESPVRFDRTGRRVASIFA